MRDKSYKQVAFGKANTVREKVLIIQKRNLVREEQKTLELVAKGGETKSHERKEKEKKQQQNSNIYNKFGFIGNPDEEQKGK